MKNTIVNISQALDSNYSTSIIIKQGYTGLVRVTATARFKKADTNPFFSKWVTYKYADKVYRELYGKKLSESINFQY